MSKSLLRLNMPPAKRTTEQLQLGNVQRHHVPGRITWALASTTVASNEIGTWTIPKESPAQLWGGGGSLLDVDHHAYYIFTLDGSGALWAVLQEDLATVSASMHCNLVAWVDRHNDLVPYVLGPLLIPGILEAPPYFGAPKWCLFFNETGKVVQVGFFENTSFGRGFYASNEDGVIVHVLGSFVDIPGGVPGVFDVWTDRDGNMTTDPSFIKLFTVTITPRDWEETHYSPPPNPLAPQDPPYNTERIEPGILPTLGAVSRLPSPASFGPEEYATDQNIWINQVGFPWRDMVVYYPGPLQGLPGVTDGVGFHIEVVGQLNYSSAYATAHPFFRGPVPMETAHLPDLPLNSQWADPLVAFYFEAHTGYWFGNPPSPGVEAGTAHGPFFGVKWPHGTACFNVVDVADRFNQFLYVGSGMGNEVDPADLHTPDAPLYQDAYTHAVMGPTKYVGQLVGVTDPLFNAGTLKLRGATSWAISPHTSIHMYVSGPLP